jgi:CubicO group peptidase (beta-lactamase class C family)
MRGVAFTVAFCVIYVTAYALRLPVAVYYPVAGEVHFGSLATGAAVGPAMFWFGWVAISLAGAALVALVNPARWAVKGWLTVSWLAPIALMVYVVVHEWRWFTKTVAVAFLCLAIPLGAQAQQATDPRDAQVLEFLARMQAESGAPGVSAAVAVKGQLVFSGGVGISDLQSGLPQNASSVHNIGSVSKTHAVVAVMQLVERGKVKLDAPIQDYAPWFPRKNSPVTLRSILTHTSGIRHYKEGEFGPGDVLSFRHYDTFEESTRFWRDDPLLFEPGSHWLYSSFAINLLQAVVESASGQPFEEYLNENVWRPAGMLETRLDIPTRIVPRRGRGYLLNAETRRLENAPDEDVSYKYAGGGILSTDEDLCRFGVALNSGRLLKPETLAEMYRLQLRADIPHTQADIDDHAQGNPTAPLVSKGLSQGLVFGVGRDAAGRPFAEHGGAVKGTRSQLLSFYRDDVVVAVHANFPARAVTVGEMAEAIAQLYLQVPPGRTKN